MVKPPKGFKGSKRRQSDGEGKVRMKHEKVKTARGRKYSSKLWLERQLNDPYVVEAKRKGYRSRAAFKLLQLNEKFHVLKSGARIVDLGAAPGGWCQVAADVVLKGKNGHKGKIVGIDLLEMEPLPNVTLFEKDFTDDDAPDMLKDALGGEADVVMSDMAAWATGHKATDHLRIIGLTEVALEFALEVLTPGGLFLSKVLQGGGEGDLLNTMKKHFKTVKHAKPDASRSDSAEMYVVAIGFKGRPTDNG
ncbi:RlmE family RNA methyltransferase [Magnetovibrio sp. PR-2]|uniref:RlmE family RNA methyltransferase n=1 Tax=Magnetovibrio sp. PR-2 TaxID=3120356 RepID=UPI002FCE2C2E